VLGHAVRRLAPVMGLRPETRPLVAAAGGPDVTATAATGPLLYTLAGNE
jgi:hypothetical protein